VSSSGYVTDVAYVRPFNCDLAPAWLDLVALLAGIAPPDRRNGFSWCELGCGQGVTAAILAATHPQGVFHGIDVNPEHIANARRLGERIGTANLALHALDFAAAADLALPRFDYIVAHGVYSWIDAPGRAHLRRFVDRHLAPGGLAHVSYNAMPGWLADLPLQYLLRTLAQSVPGDSVAKFLAAEAAARRLTAVGAPALKYSHIAAEAWDVGRKRFAPSYFAHEYLAEGWQALYVTEVRTDMAGIGLEPVGSTALAENFDAFMLKSSQREALAGFADPDLRELARDYVIMQRFRRDVFARGAKRLDADARRRRILAGTFALTRPVASVGFAMHTPAGRVRFDNPVARMIVAALANGPRRLVDIAAGADSAADVLASALALSAAEMIRPVGPGSVPVAAVNAALSELEDNSAPLPHVALPCGTALTLEQELVLHLRDGTALPERLAAWPGFLFFHLL
jgi:trans-aconitate methyltransferase